MSEIIDGIVILNKPTGMNSMRAVKQVQYKLDAKKAGHMGTLDPMGSGVLLVALGKATKLFDKHLQDRKTYRAVFQFGFETDTLDCDGKILNFDQCDISTDQVQNICCEFVGNFDQMPPIYSAKKINGKNAYQLARNGQDVQLQTKNINIYDFKLIEKLEKNTFLFQIECSSGTYIRSLCRDVAKRLNTIGTMIAIIRTKVGEFDISQSVTLEKLCLDDVVSIEKE